MVHYYIICILLKFQIFLILKISKITKLRKTQSIAFSFTVKILHVINFFRESKSIGISLCKLFFSYPVDHLQQILHCFCANKNKKWEIAFTCCSSPDSSTQIWYDERYLLFSGKRGSTDLSKELESLLFSIKVL